MNTRNLPGGVKGGRRVRLTILPPSVSRLFRENLGSFSICSMAWLKSMFICTTLQSRLNARHISPHPWLSICVCSLPLCSAYQAVTRTLNKLGSEIDSSKRTRTHAYHISAIYFFFFSSFLNDYRASVINVCGSFGWMRIGRGNGRKPVSSTSYTRNDNCCSETGDPSSCETNSFVYKMIYILLQTLFFAMLGEVFNNTPGKNGQNMKLTSHHQQVSRLRPHGTVSPLPCTHLHKFILKHRDVFIFTLDSTSWYSVVKESSKQRLLSFLIFVRANRKLRYCLSAALSLFIANTPQYALCSGVRRSNQRVVLYVSYWSQCPVDSKPLAVDADISFRNEQAVFSSVTSRKYDYVAVMMFSA
jgi:hypothetical protein